MRAEGIQSMRFYLVDRASRESPLPGECVVLVIDRWNDYGYETQFEAIHRSADGEVSNLGIVKIAHTNMPESVTYGSSADSGVPIEFSVLPSSYFSLGQDDSYYVNISALGDERRNEILSALRDVAYRSDIFESVRHLGVTTTSLLRFIAVETVVDQFRRVAQGGARLERYEFDFFAQIDVGSELRLSFDVVPNSNPPTNIHVIVGPNGSGKTRVLRRMMMSLAPWLRSVSLEQTGYFASRGERIPANPFVGLVSLTFSAFDPFVPLVASELAESIRYVHIGLQQRDAGDGDPSAETLGTQFARSLEVCLGGPRRERWIAAVETLGIDATFGDLGVSTLSDVPEASNSAERRDDVMRFFNLMSAGHKAVLLAMTRLVEAVDERTLVLIDEPEVHLHPPLLSAFVRALSDLLISRNGVAILATHSPVVLQEVPRSCVFKLRRWGSEVLVERPEIETFGESLGILTREAFGFEVDRSGFYRQINRIVDSGFGYQDIVDYYDGQLGSEARAIARALVAARDRGEPR